MKITKLKEKLKEYDDFIERASSIWSKELTLSKILYMMETRFFPLENKITLDDEMKSVLLDLLKKKRREIKREILDSYNKEITSIAVEESMETEEFSKILDDMKERINSYSSPTQSVEFVERHYDNKIQDLKNEIKQLKSEKEYKLNILKKEL